MITIKPICYIIGASDNDDLYIDSSVSHFIIAADGGFKALKNMGIEPDLIVGDFDSLCFKPEGENVIFHKPEKDDTDTMLAIKEGLERGFDTFILYGCLGGRLDHTIANLQALSFIAKKDGRGFILGSGTVITAIKNNIFRFNEDESGIVSTFCLGSDAVGVYEKKLKYELNNSTLTSSVALGVSNEFIGESAEIYVENGVLTVMWSSTPQKFISNYLRPGK